jgi:serpin B
MPKFNYSSASISLKPILTTLGMPTAFTQAADFSGINAKRSLLISDVYHKAFIAVDEKGTEASGATGVIMSWSTSSFIVDRPFLFVLYDTATGSILFLGRIVNPLG